MQKLAHWVYSLGEALDFLLIPTDFSSWTVEQLNISFPQDPWLCSVYHVYWQFTLSSIYDVGVIIKVFTVLPHWGIHCKQSFTVIIPYIMSCGSNRSLFLVTFCEHLRLSGSKPDKLLHTKTDSTLLFCISELVLQLVNVCQENTNYQYHGSSKYSLSIWTFIHARICKPHSTHGECWLSTLSDHQMSKNSTGKSEYCFTNNLLTENPVASIY